MSDAGAGNLVGNEQGRQGRGSSLGPGARDVQRGPWKTRGATDLTSLSIFPPQCANLWAHQVPEALGCFRKEP